MLSQAITAELSLDEKGRVMLPRALRRWLDDSGINKLVAFGNNGPNGGLAFVRIDHYDRIRQQFGATGPVHPEARLWALAMASTANTVSVDGNGRILIPVAQRNRFGLDKDLYLYTANDWFEVWALDRFDSWFSQASQDWERLTGFNTLSGVSTISAMPGGSPATDDSNTSNERGGDDQ